MADLLRLRVWSPAETVLEVENVRWVHVELAQARPLTIWPGHAPLLAETSGDSLDYADDTGTHSVSLLSGVLQVRGNEVLIVVSGALQASEEESGERLERLGEALLGALEPSQ